MKKIVLTLTILLIVTGCHAEKTVKNPNGTSKTYKFLKNENYNINKYTIKLRNGNENITIVNLNNKNYYKATSKASTIITIEKNNYKYTIDQNSKSYSKESISINDNWLLGYFPKNSKILKNKSYKTGNEWKGLTNYVYETYVFDGYTITYYFKSNKLKRIKSKDSFSENEVDFVSISNKVDNSIFKINKNYEEITY